MKNLLIPALSLFLLASCGSQPQPEETATPMLSVEELEMPATLAVKIEGMACPNGCAKPIEGNCAKLAGMAKSHVNFADGMGYFTYDASKLSEKDIIACIEATNGGDHYKVTEVEVEVTKTVEGDEPKDEEAVHETADESQASV